MLIWFTYFYLPAKHENYDRNASIITEVLVEDYTVAVRNVPREATPARIAEFFSVYGKVIGAGMWVAVAVRDIYVCVVCTFTALCLYCVCVLENVDNVLYHGVCVFVSLCA